MDKLIKLFKAGFPYKIVIALATMACIDHSVAMGFAAVVGMGLIMAKEFATELALRKEVKFTLPEETRRMLQDISARVTALEFGVKQRGF
jgi:hypothetical protein